MPVLVYAIGAICATDHVLSMRKRRIANAGTPPSKPFEQRVAELPMFSYPAYGVPRDPDLASQIDAALVLDQIERDSAEQLEPELREIDAGD